MLSKTKIDRAGRELAEALATGRTEPVEASALLDAWREAHAEPLQWVTSAVRRRAGAISPKPAVANRLKRKPQIVAKLARAGKMRLAQMQDIGGCRIVVDSPEDVERAAAGIKRDLPRYYKMKHEADYRTVARTRTGYRALQFRSGAWRKASRDPTPHAQAAPVGRSG